MMFRVGKGIEWNIAIDIESVPDPREALQAVYLPMSLPFSVSLPLDSSSHPAPTVNISAQLLQHLFQSSVGGVLLFPAKTPTG